ncbi:ABC transporter ATP-binding protein [Ferroacidibacillus organovorans]|uniref:ABC transporter n=1 Tax=Ferroacidibacillus organovorans TaxID=1765683 RepID=A0A853K7Y6_9BACL|nr:ABC transporter ATP-binding protein [Ferroacidibacillus organovorans]KYP81130.1 ABC transporter [Ferroacidibacillus organovorans]OAG93096.1 ABC transporter [Ferroacidibacillus organovorans]
MRFMTPFAADERSKRVPLSAVPWKRIGGYFKPYRLLLALVVLVTACGAVVGALQPVMIRLIVDRALPQHRTDLLDQYVLMMLALVVGGGLLGVLQTYITSLIGQSVMNDLRVSLYRHLHRLSMSFYSKTKTGELLSRMTNDVQQLQSVVTDTYGSTINNLLTVTATIITMYALNAELATFSIIFLPLFILPTRQVGKATFRVRKATQERIGDLSAHLSETLSQSGALLIKVFGRQAEQTETFSGMSQSVKHLQMRQALIGRWFFMSISIITSAGPALIYFVGGHTLFGRPPSIGTLVAFTVFLTRLFGPIASLANLGVNVYGSVALFGRLFEYFDEQPEIADKPNAVQLEQPIGHVEFTDVSFSYDQNRPILSHLSLVAEPGEMIALVGPSGAGKTTVSSLVARLYDPQTGAVRIDGVDLRDLTLLSLAKTIGVVTQETYLFHATLAENLRFAKPDATDEELVRAAQAAAIHEMIADLPDGYDTLVGERGHKLSGGEKQRIAIARMILKDPRIVLLDEATSALDSASERAVQDALAVLLKGRTSIVIAHRLSTIVDADRIYVIARGTVVEEGTHEALLRKEGLYANLYREQFERAVLDASDRDLPASVTIA